MSVYIVASIAVEDWEEYAKYQAGFLDVFARYNGELLAVSDEPRVIEGEWPFTRAVVLRFPSEEDARLWYESPEYQAIAQHRWRASKGTVIGFEALPEPIVGSGQKRGT
ncbi:MAG: DUF1330 domain-containing protein [Deltaproteobacteria bacterium]|nr:DUF1330 domain-containing protein [Deltaproteobacteria bacterium]